MGSAIAKQWYVKMVDNHGGHEGPIYLFPVVYFESYTPMVAIPDGEDQEQYRNASWSSSEKVRAITSLNSLMKAKPDLRFEGLMMEDDLLEEVIQRVHAIHYSVSGIDEDFLRTVIDGLPHATSKLQEELKALGVDEGIYGIPPHFIREAAEVVIRWAA